MAEPLDVKCDECGALAGIACTRFNVLTGVPLVRKVPHMRREVEARVQTRIAKIAQKEAAASEAKRVKEQARAEAEILQERDKVRDAYVAMLRDQTADYQVMRDQALVDAQRALAHAFPDRWERIMEILTAPPVPNDFGRVYHVFGGPRNSNHELFPAAWKAAQKTLRDALDTGKENPTIRIATWVPIALLKRSDK